MRQSEFAGDTRLGRKRSAQSRSVLGMILSWKTNWTSARPWCSWRQVEDSQIAYMYTNRLVYTCQGHPRRSTEPATETRRRFSARDRGVQVTTATAISCCTAL